MDMGGGKKGGGEMYGKSQVETYISICKIDSQWGFSVCAGGFSNRGSVTI